MLTMPLSEDYAYLVELYGEPRGEGPVSKEFAEQWRGRLPDELVDFWEEMGLGVWAGGRFELVDPDTYRPILDFMFGGDREFSADEIFVYGRTAFGALQAWSPRFQAVNIEPIWGKVDTTSVEDEDIRAGRAISIEVSDLESSAELDDENAKPLFERARRKLGKLDLGEVYGLKLAPVLGGAVTLESLQRVKALEYLAILAQATAFELVDRSVFPSRLIRPIGHSS